MYGFGQERSLPRDPLCFPRYIIGNPSANFLYTSLPSYSPYLFFSCPKVAVLSAFLFGENNPFHIIKHPSLFRMEWVACVMTPRARPCISRRQRSSLGQGKLATSFPIYFPSSRYLVPGLQGLLTFLYFNEPFHFIVA